MKTIKRREFIKLICIGIGASMVGLVSIKPLMAKAINRLIIGTAGKGGVFYPLGQGLAAVISKYASGLEAIPLVTSGAAENMKLLHDGKINLALARTDVPWAATQGQYGR